MNLSNRIVGIDGPVKEIKELLDGRIDCVRFVIIHGMGGIGKTTLAKVIFNEVSSEFDGCSFLSNVRESSRGSGITKLQQQVMDDIFRRSVSIHNVDYGMNEIRERSRNKKVLLVLDDVDHKDQFLKLAGMFDWFGRGSRIIVTTRDINVIPNELTMDMKDEKQNIEVEEDLGDIWVYKMGAMDHQHATILFKRHAFGADESSFDNDDLIQKFVLLADGLPLALAVVGSHLYGQTKEVWAETLSKLEKAPHGEVRSQLMISYESLEDNEKELFLDIACHFKGSSKRQAMLFWKSVENLHPVDGLNTLLHKSLIEIDDEDIIWMHDQMRDLGKEIVHRDGKHTRIWDGEEGLRVVLDGKGTSDTVLLNLGLLSEGYKFKKAGFEKLVNLRGLGLGNGSFIGDFSSCFKQLRHFVWSSFPSKFEAQNFSLPNLIVLGLENTDIDENWTGWKRLLGSNLKVLDLRYCWGLTRTPNFSACLGLEELHLMYCYKLTEIDGSLGKLDQLTHLRIGFTNLKVLPPGTASLKRLEVLIVWGPKKNNFREEFHVPVRFDDLQMLRHLAIECQGLRRIPEGIGQLKLLKYLSFQGCVNMTSLPESGWELESLVELNLFNTGIVDLSGLIGNMRELKGLDISHTKIKMLPRDIGSLTKLEELNVSYSQHLEQIPSEIESLLSLRILDLQGTSIVELPSVIDRLSHLQCLNMKSCLKLRRVGNLPASLSELSLPYFSLEDIPDLSNLVNLRFLSLLSNDDSLGFPQTDDEEVNVNQQARTIFWDISWVEGLHQLRRLVIEVTVDIFDHLKFDFESFPSAELAISCSDAQSLSQLPQNLSTLRLESVRDEFLHFSPHGNLKNLYVLEINRVLTERVDIEGFETLVNLHEICLWGSESLMRLSFSSSPQNLVILRIYDCIKLVDISGLDRMVSLQKLIIVACDSLPRLPDLSNLQKIEYIRIAECNSMESMPALPSTEHPIDLTVSDCRMLPDFVGPHNLYQRVKMVGNIKGICLCNWILKIGWHCMRLLGYLLLCNGRRNGSRI